MVKWAIPLAVAAILVEGEARSPVARWFHELSGESNSTDDAPTPDSTADASADTGSDSGSDSSGTIPPYAMVLFGMGVSLMAITCVQVMKRREDTKRAKVAQGMKAALAHQMPSDQVDRDKQAYLSLVDVDGPLSHRTQLRELRAMRDAAYVVDTFDSSSKGDEQEGSEQDEIFDKVLALFHTSSEPGDRRPGPPMQKTAGDGYSANNNNPGSNYTSGSPLNNPREFPREVISPQPGSPVFPKSPVGDGVDSRRVIAGMQRTPAPPAGSPSFPPKASPTALRSVPASSPAIPASYEFPPPPEAHHNDGYRSNQFDKKSQFDRRPQQSSVTGRSRGVVDV